jgi:hypothetical protein
VPDQVAVWYQADVSDSEQPSLSAFAVTRYKAFARTARVDLERLTLVLGRNNAGKTALSTAPVFFTHPFRPDAAPPFPSHFQSIDFCRGFLSACFDRRATGLEAELAFAGGDVKRLRMVATALPEQNQEQVFTDVEIDATAGQVKERGVLTWDVVKPMFAAHPDLARVAAGVGALSALRPSVARSFAYLGTPPSGLGFGGELAAHHLARAKREGDTDAFDRLNAWLEVLGVRVDVDLGKDAFEITVARRGGPRVNLADAGAGIPQILPLAVGVIVAPEALPRLFIIEQPEIDLHPAAHASVAELLIRALQAKPSLRLIVETHSDALVLRIRRAVAARELSHDDIALYFVDDDQVAGAASVRRIALNDRGTPEWWPKGVFAEPLEEFNRIRRILAERDKAP